MNPTPELQKIHDDLYAAYLLGCEDECLPEPKTKLAFLNLFGETGAPPAPLPPPQEPFPICEVCHREVTTSWEAHYEDCDEKFANEYHGENCKLCRPAALAGETRQPTIGEIAERYGFPPLSKEQQNRNLEDEGAGETQTEARKQYLNPQQRAKWERRLEAGMDKSEDFPECTPDQRAVLWTLLELKQSEREVSAAESRIAQLERERDVLAKFKQYVHKRLDDFSVPSDPDPEQNKVHGCRIEGRLNSAFARTETAEAALTQAQAQLETKRESEEIYQAVWADRDALRAQKSALMEAIEPFVLPAKTIKSLDVISRDDGKPRMCAKIFDNKITDKQLEQAARVYEQVKRDTGA